MMAHVVGRLVVEVFGDAKYSPSSSDERDRYPATRTVVHPD